jgi:SpoVK/Ycf46/Vps4 family AAA+-type ATPase
LFGESLSLADIGRADADLLRHAHKLEPAYQLRDLVLGPVTSLKLNEAIRYIQTKSFCEENWGFRKRHSRGHGVTVLFHGVSGTGKTMAAEAMASELSLPLYQVDLSSLVSKWVGETEKNLKAVFKAAEGVRGILLFDEGDALFSTRTEIKSSQDRNSNMEVNYLLQEIERFSGILLLSTNHFNNMDPAFLRRFTYTITFGAPVQSQRRAIWQTNLPAELPLDENVDIGHLSHFDLTGGDIRNCIRQAAARAAARKANAVLHEDFLWAIKREMQKHDLEIERELVGEKFWRKIAPEWEFKQPL